MATINNGVWREREHWDPSNGDDPTCLGNCDSGKRAGWSHDYKTGYSVCGHCRKPSPYNLVFCPCCEVVWLPPLAVMLIGVTPDRRELIHKECE